MITALAWLEDEGDVLRAKCRGSGLRVGRSGCWVLVPVTDGATGEVMNPGAPKGAKEQLLAPVSEQAGGVGDKGSAEAEFLERKDCWAELCVSVCP